MRKNNSENKSFPNNQFKNTLKWSLFVYAQIVFIFILAIFGLWLNLECFAANYTKVDILYHNGYSFPFTLYGPMPFSG